MSQCTTAETTVLVQFKIPKASEPTAGDFLLRGQNKGMRWARLFLMRFGWAAVLAGCASRRVAPHTELYSGNHEASVWTYERANGEGYITRQLGVGDRVVLSNGAVVSFDGVHIAVDGRQVQSHNAVVEHNGEVLEGAFIRSFD